MEECDKSATHPQHMLAPHHAEIQRRAAVQANEEAINPKVFGRVQDDGLDDPFVNPQQQFVLFSVSHREFAPVARDHHNPGICIYGAFETYGEALEHANLVKAAHPGHSLLIDKTHTWICAAASVAHLQDGAHIEEHRKRLLEKHAADHAARKLEFEENLANQRAGRVAAPVTENDSSVKEDFPKEDEATKGSSRVKKQCKVDDQMLAVVSVVADDGDDCEFLIRVYALFHDEPAANRYVRNVCGCSVHDHDIDVIHTCAWAFPQQMRNEHVRKEVYRSEELSKIMSSLKRAPQEVQRFREQNAREEIKEIETVV